MTQGQKVIKYIALSFACFLIFTILSSIFSLIYGIFNFKSEDFTNIELTQENIKKLDIDLNSSSLIIKESENFSIETNNKNLKVMLWGDIEFTNAMLDFISTITNTNSL